MELNEEKVDKITRVEVIDHRKGAPLFGRCFTAWDEKLACGISLQDGGRTLKVFLSDRKSDNIDNLPRTEPCPKCENDDFGIRFEEEMSPGLEMAIYLSPIIVIVAGAIWSLTTLNKGEKVKKR